MEKEKAALGFPKDLITTTEGFQFLDLGREGISWGPHHLVIPDGLKGINPLFNSSWQFQVHQFREEFGVTLLRWSILNLETGTGVVGTEDFQEAVWRIEGGKLEKAEWVLREALLHYEKEIIKRGDIVPTILGDPPNNFAPFFFGLLHFSVQLHHATMGGIRALQGP